MIVNGAKISAAARTILKGYSILRTFRSGPAITKAVFTKTFAQSVKRKTAHARETSNGMENARLVLNTGIVNVRSASPLLTM